MKRNTKELKAKKKSLIEANVEMKYNPEAKGGEESEFTWNKLSK